MRIKAQANVTVDPPLKALDPIVGCEPTHPECNIPPDEGWISVSPDPGPQPGLQSKIITAQTRIGNRCGQPSGLSLMLLVEELRKDGVCSRGYGVDNLMVRTTPLLHQEWDVVLSNGCWSQQWGGTWIQQGVEPLRCDPPMPLKTWENGSPHYRLDCKPYGDCTPVYSDVYNADTGLCDRCAAWGFPFFNGQPRCNCELGQPGS